MPPTARHVPPSFLTVVNAISSILHASIVALDTTSTVPTYVTFAVWQFQIAFFALAQLQQEWYVLPAQQTITSILQQTNVLFATQPLMIVSLAMLTSQVVSPAQHVTTLLSARRIIKLVLLAMLSFLIVLDAVRTAILLLVTLAEMAKS